MSRKYQRNYHSERGGSVTVSFQVEITADQARLFREAGLMAGSHVSRELKTRVEPDFDSAITDLEQHVLSNRDRFKIAQEKRALRAQIEKLEKSLRQLDEDEVET